MRHSTLGMSMLLMNKAEGHVRVFLVRSMEDTLIGSMSSVYQERLNRIYVLQRTRSNIGYLDDAAHQEILDLCNSPIHLDVAQRRRQSAKTSRSNRSEQSGRGEPGGSRRVRGKNL
ncbi:hypothetical protein RIF29_29838 [Crotalaria pallida]|uniref:Uncharacterized protein n=1 Tax=Crotalaria pallida TaxID=3830 RepID=A0AAN9EF93_CROPI